MSGWLVFRRNRRVYREIQDELALIRDALSGRTQEGTSAHMIPCMRHKLSVSLKEMGDCPHCRVAGEPREGEQEPPECDCGHAGTPEDKHRHACSYGRWLLAKEAGLVLADPSPDPSVASVLRLTASRLRDPEHRWSVDPAVTLEHLAERLEGGE